MISADLPGEMRFLLSVVGAGFGGAAPQPDPRLEWSRLAAWIGHHRLEPLLDPALAPGVAIPEAWREKLRVMRRTAKLRSLRMAGEAAQLARAFAAAGLDVLVVKGPPLSALLYGDPGKRSCRDLDLLVRPGDEAAARALLAQCGYGTTAAAVLRQPNAVMLRHHGQAAPVELHVRLADDDRMLPLAALEPFRHAVAVDMAGTPVRTLEINTALAYAVYHGTAHHWSRLYWLADFAAAARHPQVDWNRVAEICRRAGIRRQLALAGQLSASLLGQKPPGLPLPGRRELRRVRPAVAVAVGMLAAPPGVDRVALRRVGVVRVLLADLALHGSWRAGWAHLLARLQPSERDRELLSLPPRLGFLYPVIRMLRVLALIAAGRGR